MVLFRCHVCSRFNYCHFCIYSIFRKIRSLSGFFNCRMVALIILKECEAVFFGKFSAVSLAIRKCSACIVRNKIVRLHIPMILQSTAVSATQIGNKMTWRHDKNLLSTHIGWTSEQLMSENHHSSFVDGRTSPYHSFPLAQAFSVRRNHQFTLDPYNIHCY